MYSDELKETLSGLTYTKVWVNSDGEHSFTSKEGWNEVSREEILGDITSANADEAEVTEEVAKPAKTKKK
jgi:hypothetical protein